MSEQPVPGAGGEVRAIVKKLSRLSTLLASVTALPRRDRYRLYMSMMGSGPVMIEGEDWAFILHKMVAGRHNLEAYQRQVARLERELLDVHGIDGDGVKVVYASLHKADPNFLDPILDLVHQKLDEFYKVAGRP